MTFEYLYMLEFNISSLLLFDTVLTTFIPGKISSEKRCQRQLRSIAELRAFYGTLWDGSGSSRFDTIERINQIIDLENILKN